MSHPEQFKFVEIVKELNKSKLGQRRVLELGSYDVYGEIRSIFSDASEYVGIDLCDGPGVDVVANAHDLDRLNLGIFDIVLSCEAFEHDPDWRKTLKNAIACLGHDGVLILTCATTLRPEHGTTRTSPKESPGTQSRGWDYYGNVSKTDLIETLNSIDPSLDFKIWINRKVFDLYAVITKTTFNSGHYVPPTQEDIDLLIGSTPLRYQCARWPVRLVAAIFGVKIGETFGRHYWTFLANRLSDGVRAKRTN
jgi:SAM-dependent methyltransferase